MTAYISQQRPLQLGQPPPLELDQPQSAPTMSQQQSEKHYTTNTANKQEESQDLAVEQCQSISASNQQQSEPSNRLVTATFKLHSMYVYVSSVL